MDYPALLESQMLQSAQWNPEVTTRESHIASDTQLLTTKSRQTSMQQSCASAAVRAQSDWKVQPFA